MDLGRVGLTLEEVQGFMEVHSRRSGGVRQDQSDDSTHGEVGLGFLDTRWTLLA